MKANCSNNPFPVWVASFRFADSWFPVPASRFLDLVLFVDFQFVDGNVCIGRIVCCLACIFFRLYRNLFADFYGVFVARWISRKWNWWIGRRGWCRLAHWWSHPCRTCLRLEHARLIWTALLRGQFRQSTLCGIQYRYFFLAICSQHRNSENCSQSSANHKFPSGYHPQTKDSTSSAANRPWSPLDIVSSQCTISSVETCTRRSDFARQIEPNLDCLQNYAMD